MTFSNAKFDPHRKSQRPQSVLIASLLFMFLFSGLPLSAQLQTIDRTREVVSENNERVEELNEIVEFAEEQRNARSQNGGNGSATNDEPETISLNVDDQEISVILTNIAELFELNLVIPDDLEGRTSLNLRDVTWQQVFDIVLEEIGYSWVEVGGIIRIRAGLEQTDDLEDPRIQVLADGTLRVDFRNAAVADIISVIARTLDLNVVIAPDPELDNPLDLRLRNVTWEQIFAVALNQYGYGYIDADGIVIIKTLEEINSVPPISRVFQIKYSEADSISELIAEQSGVESVVVDTRSNVLIIKGNPANMADIKALIDTLDRPTPQVMIESRFVEISDEGVKNIGVNWQGLANFGLGFDGGTREYSRTNSRDDGSNDSDTNNFSSSSTRSGTPAVTETNTLVSTALDQVRTLVDSTATSRTDTAIFSADAFRIVLSALNTVTDSKIVSNPTVISLNGQEAEIRLTDHYYLQKPGTVSEDGRVVPGEVEKLDPLPGIELKVTPTISGGDFISLKVVPQVNEIVSEQFFIDTEIPVVRQRTALTHVMVKDRETLAIGGLIDELSREVENKVPLLGSIPGVGRLFSHKNLTTDSTNQIIFITASILNPNETNYIDIIGRERMNTLGLTDRDVMGSNFPLTDEEKALNEAIYNYRTGIEDAKRRERLQKQMDAFRAIERKNSEVAESDFSEFEEETLDDQTPSDVAELPERSGMDELRERRNTSNVIPIF